MLLDYYAYTLDDAILTRYLPLLSGTLDFFDQHYATGGDALAGADAIATTDSTATTATDDAGGAPTLRIFPTQALETYHCFLPPTEDNCPLNDHPTVAALHVLTERALELPERLTGSARRSQWARLRARLPPVPYVMEGGVRVVSPYEQYPRANNIGNVEAPELYSTHPFRYITLGRSRLPGNRRRDLAPSIQPR